MEFIGSYQFVPGDIVVRKGRKNYHACILMAGTGSEKFLRRWITDKDDERIYYRALAIFKSNLEPGIEPILCEWEGLPWPFKIKTEDDVTMEMVSEIKGRLGIRGIFTPEVADRILLTGQVGPELEVDTKKLGEN